MNTMKEITLRINEEILAEFMADNNNYDFDSRIKQGELLKSYFTIDLDQNENGYTDKISIVAEVSDNDTVEDIRYHTVIIGEKGFEELGSFKKPEQIMEAINQVFINRKIQDKMQLLDSNVDIEEEYINNKRELATEKISSEVKYENLSPQEKRAILAHRIVNTFNRRGYGEVTTTHYVPETKKFNIKVALPNGDIISFDSSDTSNGLSDIEKQHLFECVIIKADGEYEEISRYSNFVDMNRIVVQEMRKQTAEISVSKATTIKK